MVEEMTNEEGRVDLFKIDCFFCGAVQSYDRVADPHDTLCPPHTCMDCNAPTALNSACIPMKIKKSMLNISSNARRINWVLCHEINSCSLWIWNALCVWKKYLKKKMLALAY